jgi:hypothetical protein
MSVGPWLVAIQVLAPALALAAMLRVGCYPGQRALAARVRAAIQRARRAPVVCPPRRRLVTAIRGGRLIAAALAGRAPPR